MKHILFGILFVFLFLFVGLNNAMAIGYVHVAPQGYVNDFANLLNSSDRQTIENQLATLNTDTTGEVAVVTVNNLNGDYIENYAASLFNDWKIGKAYPKNPYNNGLLLLISMQEKQMKIETGYYTETWITDGEAGRILDQVTPYFNTGDYTNGIKTGVNAIDTCMRNGYFNGTVCSL